MFAFSARVRSFAAALRFDSSAERIEVQPGASKRRTTARVVAAWVYPSPPAVPNPPRPNRRLLGGRVRPRRRSRPRLALRPRLLEATAFRFRPGDPLACSHFLRHGRSRLRILPETPFEKISALVRRVPGAAVSGLSRWRTWRAWVVCRTRAPLGSAPHATDHTSTPPRRPISITSAPSNTACPAPRGRRRGSSRSGVVEGANGDAEIGGLTTPPWW